MHSLPRENFRVKSSSSISQSQPLSRPGRKTTNREHSRTSIVRTKTFHSSTHLRSHFDTSYDRKKAGSSMETGKTTKRPYENIIKQLKIRLPSPKEKFYQFMTITPFDRNFKQLQLIEYFLKQYKFFKQHPNQLLHQLARKVRICSVEQLDEQSLAVVETGECNYKTSLNNSASKILDRPGLYENNKQKFSIGDVLSRNKIEAKKLECSEGTKFIVMNRNEYDFYVSCQLERQRQKYKNFLSNLQLFKMFPKKILEKFIQTLNLQYLSKGENLYQMGDEVNHLFVVYQGRVVRTIIVELDSVNKIMDPDGYKLTKIISKFYEHRIEFCSQDLVGVSEVIDHIQTRKENITANTDTIILGIDKNVLNDSLDEYIIDRLRKYNSKKYPRTYDELCEKYQQQKLLRKEQELRKIQALQNTLQTHFTQKKTDKVREIIKSYQRNIKKSEIENLLSYKIQTDPPFRRQIKTQKRLKKQNKTKPLSSTLKIMQNKLLVASDKL